MAVPESLRAAAQQVDRPRWRLSPGIATVSVFLRCECYRREPQARPVHFTVYAVRKMRTIFEPDDIVASHWCRKCKNPLAIRLSDLHLPDDPD